VKRFPPPHLQNEVIAGIRLAAMASAPFWARRHARDALGKWRVPGETIGTAELLVSELVTNAAKFAGPLPDALHDPDLASIGIIDVTLRYLPGRLTIEVSDSDANPPVAADSGLDAESGRGLMLVQALSKEWSYYFRPSGGKTVYCVIGFPPQDSCPPSAHRPGP
jgi:anti-sigma regulatory factor (Ser/Thr protein kinase)